MKVPAVHQRRPIETYRATGRSKESFRPFTRDGRSRPSLFAGTLTMTGSGRSPETADRDSAWKPFASSVVPAVHQRRPIETISHLSSLFLFVPAVHQRRPIETNFFCLETSVLEFRPFTRDGRSRQTGGTRTRTPAVRAVHQRRPIETEQLLLGCSLVPAVHQRRPKKNHG